MEGTNMDNPKHTVVTVVVGCLVRNANDQVLLIRHWKRGWEIPQGRVEEGEGLIEAVHREVLEETGIQVDLEHLATVWSKLSKTPALVFTFLARHRCGKPTPSNESPEVGWFSPEKALALVSHPVNRDRLETLLNYAGKICYRSYTTSPYRMLTETFIG